MSRPSGATTRPEIREVTPLIPDWTPVLPGGRDGAVIDPPAPRHSAGREIPALVVAAFVIAFLVKTFVAQAFFIPSGSMIPTLAIDDRVVVSRLAYRLHEPNRGDIVVFESPRSVAERSRNGSPAPQRWVRSFFETVGILQPSAEDFIKRVVALPGETVEGRDGTVYVDGRPLREPYLDSVSAGTFPPYTVPEGHLWVMGDNRPNSSDSRVFQAIPIDSVVGRAVFIVWPPQRVGFL